MDNMGSDPSGSLSWDDFSLMQLAGVIGIGAVGLTALGWLLGSPDEEAKPQKGAGMQGLGGMGGLGSLGTMRPHNPYAERPGQLPQSTADIQRIHTRELLGTELEREQELANAAIQRGDIAKGLMHLSNAIKAARAEDDSSKLLANLHFSRAHLYQRINMTDRWRDDMATTIHILRGHRDLETDEMMAVVMMIDSLVRYFSGNEKYEEALEYTHASVELRHQILSESPNPTPSMREHLATANASLGIVCSRIGRFSEAEEAFVNSLDGLAKEFATSLNFSRTIEYYTSTLHQQGNTDMALKELDRYYDMIDGMPGVTAQQTRLLRRGASLAFTIDDFAVTKERLEKAKVLEDNAGIPTSMDDLGSLSAVYWELGEEESALKYENLMREMKPRGDQPGPAEVPLIRSNYLYTLDVSMGTDAVHLNFRFNRTKPNRREGDPVEDASEIERKLNSAFLEISIDNPVEGDAPIKYTYKMTKPTEMMTFDELPNYVPGKWYLAVVNIYKDDTMEEKLGSHRQLIWGTNLAIRKALGGFGTGSLNA